MCLFSLTDRAGCPQRGQRRSPPDERRLPEEPQEEDSGPPRDYGSSWADQLEVEVSPALAALQCSADRAAASDRPGDKHKPASAAAVMPAATAASSVAVSDKDTAPASSTGSSVRPAVNSVVSGGDGGGGGDGGEARDSELQRHDRDGRRRSAQQPPTRERPDDLERQPRQPPAPQRRTEPSRSDSERSRTSAGSESPTEQQPMDGPAGRPRRQETGRQWPDRDPPPPAHQPLVAPHDVQVARQLSVSEVVCCHRTDICRLIV